MNTYILQFTKTGTIWIWQTSDWSEEDFNNIVESNHGRGRWSKRVFVEAEDMRDAFSKGFDKWAAKEATCAKCGQPITP